MADRSSAVPQDGELPVLLRRLADMAAVTDVPCSGGFVRWRRFGTGDPLVLVHGGHGNWMHWALNIEAFATRRTVWVPDLPGYGDSSAPAQADLDGVVSALLETLDAVAGKTTLIDLAGFSFGGLVAAQAAAQRGNIRSLALLGTAGHGLPRRATAELMGWKTAGSEEIGRIMRHNLAAQMIHKPELIDAQAIWIHNHACRKARFYSRPYSRSDILPELLARIAARLLLIWGEHDVTGNPVDVLRLLAEHRPDCDSFIVEDAGHWVQFEAAETVNRLLADWLDEGLDITKTPAGEAL